MNEARARRLDRALAAAAFAVKLAASIALVSAAGFRQISDDDYARTVIAQSFAHAPALDPSGTSWLPFPFWLTGGAMLVFGRSLAVARAVAYASSAAVTALFFYALRSRGVGRAAAVTASLVASLGAWSAWTGAAPVPEGFAGPLIAVAALGLVRAQDGDPARENAPPAWASVAAFVASLSRYEAWPVAASVAVTALWRTRHARDRRARIECILHAFVAGVGPLAWMLWNAHAHGSPLHFLDRVTRYRRALGEGGAPVVEKLLVYPASFLRGFPDAALLALVAVAALVATPRRFRAACASMAAMVAMLIAGELGDGAPTHHPERALIGAAWLLVGLAAFGFEAARRMPRSVTRATEIAAVLAALLFALRVPFTLRDYPGQGEADRRAQLDRGRALRAEGATALTVTPCAYEHFALLAAYEAPERATVLTAPVRRPVTETCPTVVIGR